MKITIDASQIVYETGVSVYTKNLIRSLSQIDKKNTYQIIGGSLRQLGELRRKIDLLIENKMNFSKFLYPFPPTVSDVIFNRIGVISIDNFIGKTDVFHSSDWTQPRTDAYKITTIHDLVPVLYPNLTDPRIVSVHKRRLERVKRYADRIIVPSNTTKNDLIKLGYKQDSIVVIPEAVDPDLRKPTQKEIIKTKKRYRILGKYLLAVGTSSRKNMDRIISAFEKVRSELSSKLVVVGEVKKHVSIRNVIFLGHVPNADLSKIYCGSDALIYPSLYEGFGLPVIEAFALGVPVLTSNIGSLKEVGSDASVLVDPYSVDAIADGIIKLLLKREEYIRKGKEAVKGYSWAETAKKTLEVYNSFRK